MLINQATESDVLCLINLARKTKRNFIVAEIDKKEKISSQFLCKIFQKLSKAKIVKPSFGPTGGFILNKKPAEITLKDIIIAVQGERLVLCFNYKPKYCKRNNCQLQKKLFGGQKLVLSYFQKTTLKDLIK